MGVTVGTEVGRLMVCVGGGVGPIEIGEDVGLDVGVEGIEVTLGTVVIVAVTSVVRLED